jgi:hypothetical protein
LSSRKILQIIEVRDTRATADSSADGDRPSAAEVARQPRLCPAVMRNGEACRSPILLDDGRCRVHSTAASGSPAERGQKGGLVSGEVRREQAKSVRDRLREKVEAEADEIWRVYRDAFDAADHGHASVFGRAHAENRQ